MAVTHGVLQIQGAAGLFCKVATHSITSACFLPSGRVITGAIEGQLCSWQGGKCSRQVPGHAAGPVAPRPDGTPAYGGVRCLVLQPGLRTLLSGGADGHIIRWAAGLAIATYVIDRGVSS
jgi:microtubule-associated protein-like 6